MVMFVSSVISSSLVVTEFVALRSRGRRETLSAGSVAFVSRVVMVAINSSRSLTSDVVRFTNYMATTVEEAIGHSSDNGVTILLLCMLST